jgi:acetoin utilization protein AcuB
MTDNKIGCLPVMRDGRLIGIITETDIFKSLLELLGSRRSGVRMTMRVPDAKGVLAKMTGEIARLGGNIVNLGVFHGKERGEAYVVVKVQDVPRKDLVAAMETIDGVVVDAREG